ncbi:MAG: 50S ribosomal protein L37ae [Candidatus Micrarchaeia archaeon]
MVSRYGVKTRKKEQAVLDLKNAKYACPSCGKKKVKRVSNALWKCSSCSAAFAGGAYAPQTMVGVTARKNLSRAREEHSKQ